MKNDFNNLLPLLQIMKDREQSELAISVRQVEHLRSEFGKLRYSEPILGEQLGVQQNWLAWVTKERIRINQDLAIAIVKLDSQKQILGKVIGKLEVMQSIQSKVPKA